MRLSQSETRERGAFGSATTESGSPPQRPGKDTRLRGSRRVRVRSRRRYAGLRGPASWPVSAGPSSTHSAYVARQSLRMRSVQCQTSVPGTRTIRLAPGSAGSETLSGTASTARVPSAAGSPRHRKVTAWCPGSPSIGSTSGVPSVSTARQKSWAFSGASASAAIRGLRTRSTGAGRGVRGACPGASVGGLHREDRAVSMIGKPSAAVIMAKRP